MALSNAQAQRIGNLTKGDSQGRGKASAVRARQRAIGRELRRLFDGVVSEPVPADFLDLLQQIDETDSTRSETVRKPA